MVETPFKAVAVEPKTITVADPASTPKKPKTITLPVKQRFERQNPKTKDNPNGDPKVFVVVQDGGVFILCGEKRDQWHRLSETPPSIAAMVGK